LLYTILKPFVALCLRAFFRKIAVIGKQHLHGEGPMIFVSNHPNSFLDPLILLTAQRPQMHFIAGAEWFGQGLKNFIFRHEFNMIPVVRPWLKSGEKVSNDEMFAACYESLAEGKRIVIYPEGTSVTVSKVRELKTGAIRIKEGCEAYFARTNANYKEVKIIPVGVNYYSPRTFQSDVILNIGEPIDFRDITEKDPVERVKLMTERTREKMAELVFHFEKEDFTEFAQRIYKLYGAYIQDQYKVTTKDVSGKFLLQKGILDAIQYYKDSDPKLFEEVKKDVDHLSNRLEKHKLDIQYVGDYGFPIFLMIRLLFGSPFFLIGWTFNIIPYRITKWIFETFLRPKISDEYIAGRLNPSFIGSLAFLLGMGVFTIWYIVLLVIVVSITGFWWLIPVLLIGGYTFGLYAFRFAKLAIEFYRRVLVVNRRRRRKTAYRQIVDSWERLYNRFEAIKTDYETREA
jgi:glycerol-3-phosphate O-acyltransferase/dihydroxyacetone phosphate acyltransferase